jgi:hypothetical protein
LPILNSRLAYLPTDCLECNQRDQV